jgi:SAM-dependent methyltransferase
MDGQLRHPRHLAAGKSADTEDLIIARRYQLVNELVPLSGSVLLDFGCGNGAQTFLFAPHFPLAVGVDILEGPLVEFAAAARNREIADRVHAIHYDGSRLPVVTGAVDFAVSFEVLEHVEREDDALSELSRVIRPGGILAISVPNRWWIFETHGAALPFLPWNRVPFFSWLPKRIHDRYAHARIYRRGEVIAKIERHRFEVEESTYITAPMDVVKWPFLQKLLRTSIFRGNRTAVPFLSTAILVIARRSEG